MKNNLVYVCSPYRGNLIKRIRNIRYAKELTREAFIRGLTPITPHLYLTRALNDNIPEERKQGLLAGLDLLQTCDTILVGTRYGISEGMETEITAARLDGKQFISID